MQHTTSSSFLEIDATIHELEVKDISKKHWEPLDGIWEEFSISWL